MSETRERWRNRLPHWEVRNRPHFITMRTAGALPEMVRDRVRQIHASLQTITPATVQYRQLQRQYFLTCEKYLDSGSGFAPFRNPKVAALILEAWTTLPALAGWRASCAVVMPNHVHFLLEAVDDTPLALRGTLRLFKGRTARVANRILGRTGVFWQSDWFDRWTRDEAETARVTTYIRQNPVKAGLVRQWQDWPWRLPA